MQVREGMEKGDLQFCKEREHIRDKRERGCELRERHGRDERKRERGEMVVGMVCLKRGMGEIEMGDGPLQP